MGATHLASHQYVQQHRAFVEHQRQLHDEERHLWHVERKELHQRIEQLEYIVRQLGGQVDSIFGASKHQPVHHGSAVGNSSHDHLSQTSSTSTGDEFWRGAGGKSNHHTTRAFSESTARNASAAGNTHLAPISEAPDTMPRKKSVGFDMQHTSVIRQDFFTHPVPTVAADLTRGSLDGITFKPAALTSNGTSKTHSSSPSPMQTPAKEHLKEGAEPAPSSEAREPKPQLLDLPTIADLSESELRVKDAGHTPLVRVASLDAGASNSETPTLRASLATAPATSDASESTESRPVRPPLEHSDSYFPVVDEAAQLPPAEEQDGAPEDAPDDPALKVPLALGSLPNNEDSSFLHQLNSKLLEAQQNGVSPSASDSLSVTSDPPACEGAAKSSLEPDEHEPRLKIKRSMNFGSVFGAKNLGKGV